jgi:RNase H-fold protein (predicted Holliday junction resolvase)
MILSGAKKKDRENKSNIDKISAVIILQDYLSQLSYRKS